MMLTDEERLARFEQLPIVVDHIEELIINMAGLIHLAQMEISDNQVPLFPMSRIHKDSVKLSEYSNRFQNLIREITQG